MLANLYKKGITTAYAPLNETNEQFVYVLYDSEDHESGADTNLGDLLAGSNSDPSLIVFQSSNSETFILWTTRCETFTSTTNTRDDALQHFKTFTQDRRSRQSQICTLYNPELDEQEHKFAFKHSTRPVLAILARYNDTVLASVGIPLSDRESVAQSCRSKTTTSPRKLLTRSTLILLATILAAIACLTIFSLSHKKPNHVATDKYHSWIQYPTKNSIGPKYQLAINAHNASDWNTYTQSDSPDKWAFRIDDQAIIPAHLMDDEERHYQEWFDKRYPEVSRIARERDYVNETWLGSPALDLVPVDDMFHFSHCVLALRRYIKAKETGRHVCGRDIDEEHMHHCLDSLDWWAFPDNEMGKDMENPLRPLWWRTKVCFD